MKRILTSHNVVEKDLTGENAISREHVDNNLSVRKILHERGVKPEVLPPAEDMGKLRRKLESEEKNVVKEANPSVNTFPNSSLMPRQYRHGSAPRGRCMP